MTPGGLAVGYREWGRPDRPVALLLHGLGSDSSSWDLVGPGLGEDFRVIAPDARGHGATDWATDYSLEAYRDDVLGVMEALGVIAAVVVAHSMGGVAAYLLAATRPDAVRALVLEDPPPPDPADPPRPIPGGPEPGEAVDWRAVAQLHTWRNDPGQQWWDYADQIRCRTLVLGGQHSHMPQATVERLGRKIPRGSFRSMPTGHSIHGERPGEFLAVVLPFLTSSIR